MSCGSLSVAIVGLQFEWAQAVGKARGFFPTFMIGSHKGFTQDGVALLLVALRIAGLVSSNRPLRQPRLLYHVGKLVRQQPATILRSRDELAAIEHDVGSDGIGIRSDAPRRTLCRRIVVDAHACEVVVEARNSKNRRVCTSRAIPDEWRTSRAAAGAYAGECSVLGLRCRMSLRQPSQAPPQEHSRCTDVIATRDSENEGNALSPATASAIRSASRSYSRPTRPTRRLSRLPTFLGDSASTSVVRTAPLTIRPCA